MRRSPEKRTPSPADKAVADVIIDRNQMPRGRRVRDDRADFGRQLRAHALVGIGFKYPIAGAGGDRRAAARGFPRPCSFENAIGKSARHLARTITAAVEQHDELIGKGKRGEAIGEPEFLVMGDNHR